MLTNGGLRSSIVAAAPGCVVSLASVASADVEERLGLECAARFGRVLDAVADDREVAVYFEDEAAAVACARHLTSFEGSAVATALVNTTSEVVVLRFDADETVEGEAGSACASFGRVLDARWDGSGVSVRFATRSGAAAAVVGLDGARFDGKPVRASAGGGDTPPTAYVVVKAMADDVASAFAQECQRYGEVRGVAVENDVVVVSFATSREAAACAASLHDRAFDGQTLEATFSVAGGLGPFDAAFAAAVLDSLLAPQRDEPSHENNNDKKLEEAVMVLRARVRASPGDAGMQANLAGALLRLGGRENTELALEHAQASIEANPNSAWGHFRKGSALVALGDVAKGATSLALAAKLDPTNESLAAVARRAKAAADEALDPLDAYVATEVDAAAAKDLADAAANHSRDAKRKKRPDEKDDDDGNELDYNPRAHCYICKQWGHSKKDCPLARCQYCHEVGHRKADCPLFTQALKNAAAEEKRARRKAGYEKKKARRKEEWTAYLREQTGLEGFAALYRVLGLPERRLATKVEIKKAYHRRSLEFHPDKHPDNIDEAHARFLEIKSAYELLLEGMETGGLDGKAVFSAGDLTDGAAAQALQDKVNALADKVNNSAAWAG